MLHDDTQDRNYHLLDDLCSVAGLADEVGNVVESYDCDAYGLPTMTAHTLADLDGDGDPAVAGSPPRSDVDVTDFLTFSGCFNGSLNPPRCP